MLINYPDESYNSSYLTIIHDVINDTLNSLSRIIAIRVDLRFPYSSIDIPPNNKVMTRFIESLKAKLSSDTRRKEKAWNRRLNNPLHYVWVREYGERNKQKHYHLLLLLNKDIYYTLGRYNESNNSLSSIIQSAWCSALNINYPAHASLVHFTEYGKYYLDGNSPSFKQDVDSLLTRVKYLAKHHTKDYNDAYRSIGYSL
ncbi:inovirus Gp2 family protein [Proteus terrae]|uniref:inovirus Gp2 family protein n=1 Tax=Proteus terrae TaxID=1574161 RepID=UPI002870CC40|nr:inovirus Gp2 family protein [Proteus terrae]MDR9743321.1 inovirus Gp2 family protein [Proteus terrae]